MLNKEQEAKECLADFTAKIAEKKQALSDVIDSEGLGSKGVPIFDRRLLFSRSDCSDLSIRTDIGFSNF
ncbi:hypothetical protein [Paenibacillus kribbensis]|uniref:hypothetical protein n=1 Tax=Paenibacillus kribbensis TaxID=172713 RepID=UPI002117FCBE|nr:hypothetical protein [Paenibacillus kribbensis]